MGIEDGGLRIEDGGGFPHTKVTKDAKVLDAETVDLPSREATAGQGVRE